MCNIDNMLCFYVAGTVLVALCEATSKFPAHFKFGVSTSAYQVEGAWNVSDKTPSIWDEFTHQRPSVIDDQSTGDVACDSYHLWEKDLALAKALGLDYYRFSISWPRLLPNGFSNVVSKDGTRYYNNLINGLIKLGIEPVITIFHWDLPQNLQELGGWTNSDTSYWFEDYARVVFSLFGDRVKTWVTLNEPDSFCNLGYETGVLAPGIVNPEIGRYICDKNMLLAHGRAYRLYDKEFRAKQKGKVGITNHHVWYEPGSPDQEENTNLAREFGVLYEHPIFSETGGWPPSIEAIIANNSRAENYPRSRLPSFTEEEKALIKGSADFCGINYYTTRLVKGVSAKKNLYWPWNGNKELGLVFTDDPSWQPRLSWVISYPPGIRWLMKWLTQQYGDIDIRVFENGYVTSDNALNDTVRVQFIKDHLRQIQLSITEDGVNVTAYTAWSLIDTFEWTSGYTIRFGIVNVDFNDPKRKRTPRASAHYYANVIKTRTWDTPQGIVSNTLNEI